MGGCPRRLSEEPGRSPPPRSNKDCDPAMSLEAGTFAPTAAGEISVEALWGTREPTPPGMENPPRPPPPTPAWRGGVGGRQPWNQDICPHLAVTRQGASPCWRGVRGIHPKSKVGIRPNLGFDPKLLGALGRTVTNWV